MSDETREFLGKVMSSLERLSDLKMDRYYATDDDVFRRTLKDERTGIRECHNLILLIAKEFGFKDDAK